MSSPRSSHCLRQHYASQAGKHWFDDELFRGAHADPRNGVGDALRGGVHVPQAAAGAGMIIRETEIEGVRIVEPERHEDERGFFARTWDAEEFRRAGWPTRSSRRSVSFNRRRGTLRGMHYQAAPHEEAKLVRCTAGAIFDVVVDLRRGVRHVPPLGWHRALGENRLALYAPEGCAHGFLTLDGRQRGRVPDVGAARPRGGARGSLRRPRFRDRVAGEVARDQRARPHLRRLRSREGRR